MIVAQLSLADFRNYETLEVELVPGPNVFVGSNGQGKTNLVEAIAYLSTLGSHRVSSDQALIRSGADAAIVRARLEHAERDVLLEVQLNRTGANRAQVNRVAGEAARAAAAHRDRAVRARGPRARARASRPGAGGSSTSCSCSSRRGSPASWRTTTACCGSATAC